VANSRSLFRLPERLPPEKDNPEFEVKHFKQWVDELPVGNVGQTAKELYKKIKCLNRTEIHAAERLRLLNLVETPFQFVIETVSEGYLREPIPLNKRNRSASELVKALHLLIVQGYKITLNQFHHESIAGRLMHRQGRVEALFKVIYYLGQELLHSYQIYRLPHKHLWHELHGLYNYGVEHRLNTRPVETELPAFEHRLIIETLYKRILLLSLSGPYRLMQGEVRRVYMALCRWAPKASLIHIGKAGSDAGLFLVDSDSDNPPRYRGQTEDLKIEHGWVLETQGLADAMATELESAGGSDGPVGALRPTVSPDTVSSDLLARLMVTWGLGVDRREERTQCGGDVLLTSGLETLYLMSGGEEVPEIADGMELNSYQAENDQAETLRNAEDHFVDASNDLNGLKRMLQPGGDEGILDLYTLSQIDENHTHGCELLDESESGFHLKSFNADGCRIHVGEMVGIQRRLEGIVAELQFGVIRWIQGADENSLEFGVELLHGEMDPVIVIRRRDRFGHRDFMPGFVQKTKHENVALISTPFYAGPNDQVTLVNGHMQQMVKLSRMLEGSASFAQFSFSVIDDGQGPGSDDGGDQNEDEIDFDHLWTNL
jgi:hypothetical protein